MTDDEFRKIQERHDQDWENTLKTVRFVALCMVGIATICVIGIVLTVWGAR